MGKSGVCSTFIGLVLIGILPLSQYRHVISYLFIPVHDLEMIIQPILSETEMSCSLLLLFSSTVKQCCECKSTMGRLLWIIMVAIVIAVMVYEVDLNQMMRNAIKYPVIEVLRTVFVEISG